jgi:hypothetical protein
MQSRLMGREHCGRKGGTLPSPGQLQLGIGVEGTLWSLVSPTCISHALFPSFPSLSALSFPAPTVKGKRKQSEEGDPQDPPVSPKPDGEKSRSHSPIHLEVSQVSPWGLFPATLSLGSACRGNWRHRKLSGARLPPALACCRVGGVLHWNVQELGPGQTGDSLVTCGSGGGTLFK